MKKLFLFILISHLLNNVYGQTWSAVGAGIEGSVRSMVVYNGELYIAGDFYASNGTPFGVAKWDGNSFDTLPGNQTLGYTAVNSLIVFDGKLVIGGQFCPGCGIYNSTFKNIAMWDGLTWSALGDGFDSTVSALAVYNNKLYAGGAMGKSGSTTVDDIARWNGSQWEAIGAGITGQNSTIKRLEVYNDELYAAGNINFNFINSSGIARWNDTLWNEVGPGGINGSVYSLGIYNNELYTGGSYFTTAGGVPVNQIAKWNGATWSAVGSGIGANTGTIHALYEYNNALFAGGIYTVMDGDTVNCISKYNGSVWDSVGLGVDSTLTPYWYVINAQGDTFYFSTSYGILAFQEFNNELYVGGFFNKIGGVAAFNIAKFGSPISVNENTFTDNISIYPNPADEKIIISSRWKFHKQTVQIYNYIGQSLYYDENFTDQSIKTVDLGNGIYFLKYSDGINTCVKKFIVKHL